MKDQLRYSRGKTVLIVGGSMAACALVCGFIQYRFRLPSNNMILPIFAVCFLAYRLCLRAPLCKLLAVFSSSVALMSILANIALTLGVLLYGGSFVDQPVWQSSLFQFLLNAAFTGLLAFPFGKYGSAIVNETQQSRIWYTTLLFSAAVFFVNMLLLSISLSEIKCAEGFGL